MNNQVQVNQDEHTQEVNLEYGKESLVDNTKKELAEIITPGQLRLILITRDMHEETIHMLAEVFEHVLS